MGEIMQNRKEQDDKDRIRRIREAQLSARDPGSSKIPGYDWGKHAAKPKPKPKPLLLDLWDILPSRWKGALYGVILGAILGVILLFVLPGEWRVLALIPVLIAGIAGMVLGKLFQNDVLK
jgi:hypothetical protein